MRYQVQVGDEAIEVEVRDRGAGLEVSVAGGPFQPARLAAAPAPLHTLELGSRRRAVLIQADPLEPGALAISAPGSFPVRVQARDARALSAERGRAASRARGPALQRSAMPGVIIEVRVAPGQEVAPREVLLILEAMKMQNEIRAERGGRVKAVHVAAGDAVPAGAKLIEFEPAE